MTWSGIPKERIDSDWDIVAPYIDKALAFDNDYSLADVKAKLKSGSWQCWLCYDDTGFKVAAVTAILVFPQQKVLSVMYAGADAWSMDSWVENFEVLKAFARHHGCVKVRVEGRPGWLKVFKPDQYRVSFDLGV